MWPLSLVISSLLGVLRSFLHPFDSFLGGFFGLLGSFLGPFDGLVSGFPGSLNGLFRFLGGLVGSPFDSLGGLSCCSSRLVGCFLSLLATHHGRAQSKREAQSENDLGHSDCSPLVDAGGSPMHPQHPASRVGLTVSNDRVKHASYMDAPAIKAGTNQSQWEEDERIRP
jgi:hypothetical protein